MVQNATAGARGEDTQTQVAPGVNGGQGDPFSSQACIAGGSLAYHNSVFQMASRDQDSWGFIRPKTLVLGGRGEDNLHWQPSLTVSHKLKMQRVMWIESPLPQSLPSRNLPPEVLLIIKPVQTLPSQSILHMSFHLIHTLVNGPEENLSNLVKDSPLSYNWTNYRNFIVSL